MSQVATYRDKRQVVAKTYAPGGCPVHLGKQKCGETQGLDIIMDFHKLYQEKMSEIDVSAGGDSLQEKVSLQEQWINDLTEQNKLLAKVIEELESETIGRVQQLEDKLNNAVKSIGEDDKPALPEKQKIIEEPKKTPVAVPPVEDDLKKKTEENDRLKQGHQLKHLEGKLPVIIEVSEQDIAMIESVTDVRTKDQSTDSKDLLEDFIKDIRAQGQSTPPVQAKKQLPACKDYCYLWKLVSEITALKWQVNLKDELLVQQLEIIKVLATRLYVMENCLKKTGKTAEEIVRDNDAIYFHKTSFFAASRGNTFWADILKTKLHKEEEEEEKVR